LGVLAHQLCENKHDEIIKLVCPDGLDQSPVPLNANTD
jgi:hypothetical protein